MVHGSLVFDTPSKLPAIQHEQRALQQVDTAQKAIPVPQILGTVGRYLRIPLAPTNN